MSGNSEETNMIQEGASSQTIVAHKTVYMNLKSTSQKCCLRSFLTIMIKNCWSRNFNGNRTLPKAITESPYFHIRVTKSKIVYLLVRSEHYLFDGSPSIPWLQWIQVIITWFSGIITLHQCMKKYHAPLNHHPTLLIFLSLPNKKNEFQPFSSFQRK